MQVQTGYICYIKDDFFDKINDKGLMIMASIVLQCSLILDNIVKVNKEKYDLNLLKLEENN